MVLSAWAALAVLVDESPDPGIERFIASPAQVPDEKNAAIALAGIAAPPGVDPVAHGRFVARTIEAGLASEPWSTTQERINVPGTLRLSLEGDALSCWLDPALAKMPKCATEDQVRDMLRSDAELLSRYQRAILLPEFQGGLHNGVLFLNVNKALFAQIQLDLRDGRPALALARWRANHAFLARALRSPGNWVEKAILLVSQGFSLQGLEPILQRRFPIDAAEYDALARLLQPQGIAAYDIEGTLRAEYALFRPVFEPPARLKFWVHPHFIRNRFYRFSTAFAAAAQAPPGDLRSAFQEVEETHAAGWSRDYLRDPMNALFVRGLLKGQAKAGQMLKQMHILEGHKALLVLRLEIHRHRLADDEIPSLLARSPLRDPSGDPLRWDPAKRSLWFPVPEGEGARREVYL